MCVNCISNAEFYAAHAALVGAVLKQPVHRILAEMGVVDPYDPVKRDVRTVSFLRALDLDPVAVLGDEAVARADAWVPHVRETAPRSRLPIGSQSLFATQ